MALLDLDAMREDLATWGLDSIHVKDPTIVFFGYSFLEVTQLYGPERLLLQLAE
jgi:MOSC domain-containing protein YiiM